MTDVSATVQPWSGPAERASLPAPGEEALGIEVTNRAVLRHGRGVVPVSGELHYSRVPRARWRERLERMRANGITLVSTYVIWAHHVLAGGATDFTGDRDVAAFIDEAHRCGLGVVLRIGPWAHGEVRNGGFPDTVQDLPVTHRTNDPGYLAVVRPWFARIGEEVARSVHAPDAIWAIQVENELYDQPAHLTMLQQLAREAGLRAPLWTATAWGGAELPPTGIMPLFGGYADGFWVDPQEGWHPSFRQHFVASHEWDDPGTGADVRAALGTGETASGTRLLGFPPATCELGGGMATAYHRRPVPSGTDIAAVAHAKIGDGSAWQGYYMFAGGRNPRPGLGESHATGYPNDVPDLSYDFHAPLGQAGTVGPALAPLRVQHAFLQAFGDQLAEMRSILPDSGPPHPDDRESLRWAARLSGDPAPRGFVVVTHHRAHEQVGPVADVRFTLHGDTDLAFPDIPATIPPATLARFPVNLSWGDARLSWATASAVTMLEADIPTLVLVAVEGVPARAEVAGAAGPLSVGTTSVTESARMLLLPAQAQDQIWVIERGGHRTLFLSDGELRCDGSGTIFVRGASFVEVYDPVVAGFVAAHPGGNGAAAAWPEAVRALSGADRTPRSCPSAERTARSAIAAVRPPTTPVVVRLIRAAGDPPADYGFRDARHSAPAEQHYQDLAARFVLELPPVLDAADPVLCIEWEGDAARLCCDGDVVDDRFWDGTPWYVSLTDLGPGARELLLEVLPLSPLSTIGLAGPAARAQRTSPVPLVGVRRVGIEDPGPWLPLIRPS
ncbi:beta-galactosidase [Microbacterium sp. GXS0129]|uniref:beta-galactosidase n=1 Tax=Microbacterium sp. GXS0129 TaxID=3377836 RepID=UPI00383A3685